MAEWSSFRRMGDVLVFTPSAGVRRDPERNLYLFRWDTGIVKHLYNPYRQSQLLLGEHHMINGVIPARNLVGRLTEWCHRAWVIIVWITGILLTAGCFISTDTPATKQLVSHIQSQKKKNRMGEIGWAFVVIVYVILNSTVVNFTSSVVWKYYNWATKDVAQSQDPTVSFSDSREKGHKEFKDGDGERGRERRLQHFLLISTGSLSKGNSPL